MNISDYFKSLKIQFAYGSGLDQQYVAYIESFPTNYYYVLYFCSTTHDVYKLENFPQTSDYSKKYSSVITRKFIK